MALYSVVVVALIFSSFQGCTAADPKPETAPEIENNNDELDGLVVSGGPEYVYDSEALELPEEEDAWFADELEHHIVKRQTSPTPTLQDGYLRQWGEVLIVGRSQFGQQPLHYASAYNAKENKYVIIYDVGDIQTDLPRHVYAAVYNPICIQHPGTKIGERRISQRVTFRLSQGWPSVAYNPIKDGYLVLYQIFSKRSSVLVGQRLRSEPTRLVLDSKRFIAFNFMRRGRRLKVSSSAIIYTPRTTGYAIAAEVEVSYLNIFMGCLLGSGSVWHSNRVYAFRSSSVYNPELVYDPVREEVFIIATSNRAVLERTNRVTTSSCVNTSDDYVLLVTKRTAVCSRVRNWNTAIAFGSSKIQFPRVRAVWDEVRNVLVVTWDSLDASGNEISLTATIDGRNVYCDSQDCPNQPPRQHSFLFHNQICNQTVNVWEEKIGSQWLIGGSDFPPGFLSEVSRGQSENYPEVLYENRHDNVMVVWKDILGEERTIRVRCLKRLEVACPLPPENATLDVCWVYENNTNFFITGTFSNKSSCGDMVCYMLETVAIHYGPDVLQEDPLFASEQSLFVCMKRPFCCDELKEGIRYMVTGHISGSQLVIPVGEGHVVAWSDDLEAEALEQLISCE